MRTAFLISSMFDFLLASLAELIAPFMEMTIKPERMPMIAMTTRSSIKVKDLFDGMDCMAYYL